METTAQFVARARKKLGWSQARLAKALKYTRESVGRWERGEHDMPREPWAKLEAILQRHEAKHGA